MAPPKISIALATYNGAKNIDMLLTSLAHQTHPPAELVVGDDASTDNTLAAVHSFAATSPFPIRLHANARRLGYADNFLNVGSRCRGDIVAFCDQDDVWHADKLARVADSFTSVQATVLVAHHATVVDAIGIPLGRTFPTGKIDGQFSAGMLPLDHFPGFTLSVRREVLAAADPWRRPLDAEPRVGKLSHDAWVWLLAGCIGTSIVLADELVSYRQDDNFFGDLHTTRGERLRRATAADSETYERQKDKWDKLASYLNDLQSQWRAVGCLDWAAEAANRADQFRTRSALCRARGELYSSPNRAVAARRYVAMIVSGGYRAMVSAGVASRAAAGKDLVTVFARHFPIRAPGRQGPTECV